MTVAAAEDADTMRRSSGTSGLPCMQPAIMFPDIGSSGAVFAYMCNQHCWSEPSVMHHVSMMSPDESVCPEQCTPCQHSMHLDLGLHQSCMPAGRRSACQSVQAWAALAGTAAPCPASAWRTARPLCARPPRDRPSRSAHHQPLLWCMHTTHECWQENQTARRFASHIATTCSVLPDTLHMGETLCCKLGAMFSCKTLAWVSIFQMTSMSLSFSHQHASRICTGNKQQIKRASILASGTALCRSMRVQNPAHC